MKSSLAILNELIATIDAALSKGFPFPASDQKAFGIVEAVEHEAGGLAMANRNGRFSAFDDAKGITYYHRLDYSDQRSLNNDTGYGDAFQVDEVISCRLGIGYNRRGDNAELNNYEISRRAAYQLDGMLQTPSLIDESLLSAQFIAGRATLDSYQALQDEFRSLGNGQATIERGFVVLRYVIALKYKANCIKLGC